MNWYKGDIEQAILESRQKSAIFVVYVAGKDPNTDKMTDMLNENKIRSHLESEHFVAIRIESDSQSYMQFASIYQVVPVPSIFFIGKTGAPIEIGTSVLQSVDELNEKIQKVLISESVIKPNSASTVFIAAEKIAAADAKPSYPSNENAENVEKVQEEENKIEQNSNTPIHEEKNSLTTGSVEPSTSSNALSKESDIVCEDGVCYKRNSSKENSSINEPMKIEHKENSASSELNANIAATRDLLEQQRRKRIEDEKQEEKERELRRRREGKEMLNLQEWQREQELKELKDNIRRERMEEQAARERIRAQIAADRAERAQKFSVPTADANIGSNKEQAGKSTQNASAQGDTVRLQFRLLNGDTHMHAFKPDSSILELREYVSHTLLNDTSTNDFMLCTAYPRYEFTIEDNDKTLMDMGLFPSAVILVINKASYKPTAIIERSGGIINIISTLFWTMLSPVLSVYNYLRRAITNKKNDPVDGPQKRANEDSTINSEAAKRRNLDGFMTGPSTSKKTENFTNFEGNNEQKPYRRYGTSNVHHLTDMKKDSDDENATWNGNSTQQQ